jgi:hypothetical protein
VVHVAVLTASAVRGSPWSGTVSTTMCVPKSDCSYSQFPSPFHFSQRNFHFVSPHRYSFQPIPRSSA